MQGLRIASLVIVHVLIIAHIYIFGDSVIGSVDFQEFFHSFIKSGIVNAGTILVVIAFVTTLIFGRFFCGWACHFGALQEFSWYILKKLNITPKTINSKLIFFLPLFMLIYFYLTPNIIVAFTNPWHEPQLQLSYPGIWAFLPGFFIALLTFIVDGVLIVYFLGRKGFCRYICPWGAFLKIPNALSMYKVRNNGSCTNTNLCTTNCPVAIDVSYEINNYNKVVNTNCTSCLICTEGCPSNALSYEFMNPFKENIQFKDYFYKNDSYRHPIIKNLFKSIRKYDVIFFILTIFIGFCIDGLYGMGHFLSFGIALIGSLFLINLWSKDGQKYLQYSYTIIIMTVILWHGMIKYTIWQGLKYYDNKNYRLAAKKLELVVNIYPKKISKYHIIIGESYLHENNIKLAKYHAKRANSISPEHNAPKQLLKLIEISEKQLF